MLFLIEEENVQIYILDLTASNALLSILLSWIGYIPDLDWWKNVGVSIVMCNLC